MMFSKSEIQDLYRKRARHYDIAVWSYRLIGMREWAYRKATVESLALKPGDRVIDLACGSGLNFPYLVDTVQECGRITGVDLTDEMLDQARKRVDGAGWRNVELERCDLADYQFPGCSNGILSTFSMALVPEFDTVIKRAAESLIQGGRLAILDIKKPSRMPDWMFRFTAWLNKSFGVTMEYAQRKPWESIHRYLRPMHYQEFYGGYIYLSVGEAFKENQSKEA